MLLPEKHKIVKATNLRFVEDNESCKSTNLQKVSQLEKVEQEILTDDFDRIDSSKNENCVEKDFEILSLNSSSLQNSLILLSSLSLPAAADQVELQNLTPTNATNLISRSLKIIDEKQDRKLSIKDKESQASADFFTKRSQ